GLGSCVRMTWAWLVKGVCRGWKRSRLYPWACDGPVDAAATPVEAVAGDVVGDRGRNQPAPVAPRGDRGADRARGLRVQRLPQVQHAAGGGKAQGPGVLDDPAGDRPGQRRVEGLLRVAPGAAGDGEIGRASCRARGSGSEETRRA